MTKNSNALNGIYHIVSCLLVLFLTSLFPQKLTADTIAYSDNWGNNGFTLVQNNENGLEIIFSLNEVYFDEMLLDNETVINIGAPGILLQNNAGAPNLPGSGQYIALPNGAAAEIQILDYRIQEYSNIKVAPAPEIPFENDDSPLKYFYNPEIYERDASYPESPVSLSEKLVIRGVETVIAGITPFQYNPVTENLTVYTDMRIQVNFIGGAGYFGEDRLRSRYWEPILKSNILNYSSLPQVDFNKNFQPTDETGFEYLIIVPNDSDFIAWADTIKNWRKLQGIETGVVTLSEIGGNNSTVIDNYIINAYYSWDIPPVAILILSDYQNSGDSYGITSPIWNGYCVSDNMYADVMYDNLPDIALARITAQNATHLENMIGKMLDYEQNPPTDPNFYDVPLIAGGWQTERWFILCTEVIFGYHYTAHGKNPHREYAIYQGTPGTIWSTATNTQTVVNYFGPGGLDYIRDTPQYLTNWSGNATGINTAINNGAFMVVHRDHGYEYGWGEPGYNTGHIYQLNNDFLPFVFSINCLTGKYNISQACFAEVFHRHQQGALGLIAASEVSYSFVNDAYVWGMWDSMWPDFDPNYGADEIGSTTLRPCFANASGKYYLQASSWPYNTNNKTVTYHLFHHHGDAFITLYTEVPEQLSVTHPPIIFDTDSVMTVTADEGAVVALTVAGEIAAVAESEGGEMEMVFEPQLPGQIMTVTATLQNKYRFTSQIDIIPNAPVYILFDSLSIDDSAGNSNGLADLGEELELSITVKNVGSSDAVDVYAEIVSDDEYVTVIDGEEHIGAVAAGGYATTNGGFTIEISPDVPDLHDIQFTLIASEEFVSWESPFSIMAHAPNIVIDEIAIDDNSGNNNGLVDPGEMVDMEITVHNYGSCDAEDAEFTLTTGEILVTVTNPNLSFANLQSGEETTLTFPDISAHEAMEQGTVVDFSLNTQSWGGYDHNEDFPITVGNDKYKPVGPDGYGYYAYDSYDGTLAPEFDWMEIAPIAGGQGADLSLGNDQTVQVDLPFTFIHYGEDFTEISVCSNGWMSFGSTFSFIPVNLQMPNAIDPNNMISAFWDDLNPASGGQVCTYYNTVDNTFIIEWYQVPHIMNPAHLETFQIRLYDPQYYTTPTGDGEIVIDYLNVSPSTEYCTVGFEDGTGTIGIQYLYNNNYANFAMPLESVFSIKFTTNYLIDPNAPEPFSLLTPADGDTIWSLPGELVWQESIDPNPGWTPEYDIWLDINPDLSGKWMAEQNNPDTVFAIEQVNDDAVYYWTVRATDINSAGTWANDTLSFITYFPEEPQAFTLIEPVDGALLPTGATIFRWTPATDPDPGDIVDYTIWFVANGDSAGYAALADSIAVDPDSIDVLTIDEEAEWYVAAHSNFPEVLVLSNERYTLTPTLGIDTYSEGLPKVFSLSQNYPNPFNPETNIKFGIPKASQVRITAYDILGRRAAVISDNWYNPGYYNLVWNASSVSSGIYFIRMETGEYSQTIKTLLMK